MKITEGARTFSTRYANTVRQTLARGMLKAQGSSGFLMSWCTEDGRCVSVLPRTLGRDVHGTKQGLNGGSSSRLAGIVVRLGQGLFSRRSPVHPPPLLLLGISTNSVLKLSLQLCYFFLYKSPFFNFHIISHVNIHSCNTLFIVKFFLYLIYFALNGTTKRSQTEMDG